MQTPVEGPVAAIAPSPKGPSARRTLVAMVAAVHLVAGGMIAASVGMNLALDIGVTGGPMGFYGAESIWLASILRTMSRLHAWDALEFRQRCGGYACFFSRHAQTSPEFHGLIAGVYLGLGGLCGAIGYGLLRRLRWALTAGRILMGGAAGLAAIHGVLLLASRSSLDAEGAEVLAVTAAVAGPILALLFWPGTAALFDPAAAAGAGAKRVRHWWTLSVQWSGAVVVLIFALGLIRILAVGPLVEVVWALILAT